MGSSRKNRGLFRWVFTLIVAVALLWLLIGMDSVERIAVSILPNLAENREKKILLKSEKSELVDKVTSLQQKNLQLENELSLLKDATSSQSELQSFDSYWKDFPEVSGVTARIILRDPYNLYTSFIIDKGSSDGITVGMPVLGKKQVVGRVTEVHDDFSRVRCITSPKLSFGAHVQRTRDLGVLVGGRKELYLTFLTFNSDVTLGDEIITSGTIDTTPGGLHLGKVIEVIRKNPEEELVVKVGLEEDINQLTGVLVVTSARNLPAGASLKDGVS
jgi:rod shape-determining protein MreC